MKAMRSFRPSLLRRRSAVIAFTLSLATGLLIWNSGRQAGRAELHTPIAKTPTISQDFLGSESADDYARKLALLKGRMPLAKTVQERRDLARELSTLGRSAHLRNKGAGELSLKAYGYALDLLDPLQAIQEESEARMDLASTLEMLGRPREALAELHKALAIVENQPGTELRVAEILWRLGETLGVQGRYQEAREHLDRALRIRQKAGEFNGQADCLRVLGRLAFEEGQGALARQLLGEAKKLYTKEGKLPAIGAVLGLLGDVALSEGEIDEARQLFSEGLAIWRKIGNEVLVGGFLSRQARLALAEGDLDTAQRLSQESLTLLESSNSPTSTAAPLIVLGELALRRGELEKGKVLVAQARKQYQQRGSAFGLQQVKQLETRM